MKRVYLKTNEMPKQWYNILADLPTPMDPPLSPFTKKTVTFDEMKAIFPESLIEQEMSDKRWIDIPEEVLEILSLWRPTPLIRAERLEEYLGTPAKIYFKYEGVSPAGSHKPNTAVAQAYYNKKEGVQRLTTETGAGQWGSALAFATKMFNMECRVYMVKVSFYQKPYRKSFMRMFGAEVIPSPSEFTNSGRAILEKNPDSNGSLGIAISEAVEEAAGRNDTNYALGSVLNHVLLHQTVIGLEAKKQFEIVGDYPDMIFASCGGGSNFGGIAFPFLADKFSGKNVDAVAVEPASCPTLTKGKYAYDYGDVAKLTPIMPMFTLGHDFEPPAIHAGGLRYHGDSPIVSKLYKDGLISATAVKQLEVFQYGTLFAQLEGIVPAPESAHAIAATIKEAIKCKETGEEKTLLFCLSGHGFFDMASYDAYFDGKLEDYEYPEDLIEESLKNLPEV
ncbi:tryptophan synthase, beta subunit [Deferribacter desulfuricans SSM1]|uniref:Tryptophan synthase beta chain n=1 Tax=Deferribacter desulfuricans (strain DSM 14783 / JCM 11476 / NBRC 101012 / SSM1) TaxID=639282 RepID=D3PE34_DEFDS|nr:TrpB-like pyridoxal phosphate-dependent enzyme [Deferribacter desulfuricans]BAI80857.1 tryptophan synthase, beta subunit [Deferribacter desulfuricans SSM1]